MGYIGLSLALILAENHNVIGVEKNSERLADLQNKKCFVKTYDVRDGNQISAQEYLEKYFGKTLAFTSAIADGLKDADAVVIVVNCYPEEHNAGINYDDLISASEEVGKHLKIGQLVGVMTTTPPGGVRKVVQPILEKNSNLKAGKDFFLAHIPEWISEQHDSLYQFRTIPRLIGGINKASTEKWASVFSFLPHEIVKLSSPETSELAKLFENTYLFMNIAFANECGRIAELFGADGFEAIEAANKLDKVKMAYPGVWGGSCLPKDYRLLTIAAQEETGYIPKLIWAARDLFYDTNEHVVRKVREKFGTSTRIGFLGLAFKPNTDDTRNSPAFYIMEKLRKKGYRNLVYYDPFVKVCPVTGAEQANSAKEVWENSDCVIVCAGWGEFKELNLAKTKYVIDAVGIFRKNYAKNLYTLGSGKTIWW